MAPCRVDESAAAKIESLGDELKRDGIEVGEQAVLLSCLELLQDCPKLLLVGLDRKLLAFLRATNFDQQEARARLLDTTDWRAATLVKDLCCRIVRQSDSCSHRAAA